MCACVRACTGYNLLAAAWPESQGAAPSRGLPLARAVAALLVRLPFVPILLLPRRGERRAMQRRQRRGGTRGHDGADGLVKGVLAALARIIEQPPILQCKRPSMCVSRRMHAQHGRSYLFGHLGQIASAPAAPDGDAPAVGAAVALLNLRQDPVEAILCRRVEPACCDRRVDAKDDAPG